VNHKGGVGKTTTTLNLGKALSLQGKKVLLIDIDPQANLSQSAGLENSKANLYHFFLQNIDFPVQHLTKNFDIVTASLELNSLEFQMMSDVNGYFKLKKGLKTVSDQYDFVLIDCPPSLGILTINAMTAATEIIVCIQSQFLAMKGLNNILDFVESLRENHNPNLKILGLLLTQINNTVLSKNIVQTIQDNFAQTVFQTLIRQNVALAECTTQGKDIFSYDLNSNGAKDYMSLAQEILKLV
jgi:chromosome partitioning protein